jgi:MFS family permease
LAPVLLLTCRMLQGLALGGEYAGAAVYVAEHAPSDRRGFYTGWIQASTSVGQLLAISVIFSLQFFISKDDFAQWGWRVPFLLSAVILAISLYVRSRLEESPAFVAMKELHRETRKPVRETLGWSNLKLMLIALFGAVAGHAALGNMGLVFSLLYLQAGLHINSHVTIGIYAVGLVLSLPFFVFFGWLSDRIGRKALMVTGMLLAAASYIPIYMLMKHYANPVNATALALLVFAQMVLISFVFGPLAAYLVELFPTRVRTTSLSIPYNIGTGVIGGLLPLIVFSVMNATGSIYFGLIYPISIAVIAAIINIIFVRDRHGQVLE